jgi:hypothetical protein
MLRNRKKRDTETRRRLALAAKLLSEEARDKKKPTTTEKLARPMLDGLIAASLSFSIDEVMHAPGSQSIVNATQFITELLTPLFRFGFMTLSAANAYLGDRSPALHAIYSLFTGLAPGARTFIFALKDIGQGASVIVLGDSTGTVKVSNAVGAPIIVLVGMGGIVVWFFSTGIIGQIQDKYLQIDETTSKKKKFLTYGLRGTKVVIKAISYTSLLGILPLLGLATYNLFTYNPLAAADADREERLEKILAPFWIVGASIALLLSSLEERGIARNYIRYIGLLLSSIALTWFAALKDNALLNSGDSSEFILAIIDFVSMAGVLAIPLLVGLTWALPYWLKGNSPAINSTDQSSFFSSSEGEKGEKELATTPPVNKTPLLSPGHDDSDSDEEAQAQPLKTIKPSKVHKNKICWDFFSCLEDKSSSDEEDEIEPDSDMLKLEDDREVVTTCCGFGTKYT